MKKMFSSWQIGNVRGVFKLVHELDTSQTKQKNLTARMKYGSNQQEVEGGTKIDPHNRQSKAVNDIWAFYFNSLGHF